MRSLELLSFLIIMLASTASAGPLAEMEGNWRGEGWAKQSPGAPRERIRCRLDNRYNAQNLTLSVTGRCAVPGRQLTLSGTLVGDGAGARITGRWFNPDGIGSVRINGIQQSGLVAFTFAAKDPETGDSIAQNVEWRIGPDELRLRSADRTQPEILLSDLTFSR